MKKILIGVVASIAVLSCAPASAQHYNHHYHNHGNRDNAILGAVIGGVITGVILNSQRQQVIIQQPQVIYQQAPQVIYQQAPQQVCEVKLIQDNFGQVREFTACYYR